MYPEKTARLFSIINHRVDDAMQIDVHLGIYRPGTTERESAFGEDRAAIDITMQFWIRLKDESDIPALSRGHTYGGQLRIECEEDEAEKAFKLFQRIKRRQIKEIERTGRNGILSRFICWGEAIGAEGINHKGNIEPLSAFAGIVQSALQVNDVIAIL